MLLRSQLPTGMSLPPRPAPCTADTILIVEDSASVRGLVIRLLEEAGYGVLTAADGIEALEVLAGHSVGLVLADLKMPRMDGHELARVVHEGWPSLPMIFMTGHPEPGDIDWLPGPVILKPFVITGLVDLVEKALAGPK